MEWKDGEEIRQCLSACGCSQEEIRQYIQVVEHGTKADQLCWLKRQRRMLMDRIHETQRNVDCMDYIIKLRGLEPGQLKNTESSGGNKNDL